MTGPLAGAALLLPGEGSATPGALDPWLADPAARDVAARAAGVLGRDVAAWWRDPLALRDPATADLAAVVTGIAGALSLRGQGSDPVVVAGHGVGEHAALVAAGALPLEQVVALVAWRAELLAHLPRPSCEGMAAVVGPDAGAVARALVARYGTTGRLAVACLDGPERVVLAGCREELARSRPAVLEAGLELVRIPGRAPCHGPRSAWVADRLAASLAELDWSVPEVPVVPNADGTPTRDPDRLAWCLRRHLTSPVRWEATSAALAGAGATRVVEVGAVPVLGPLVRSVDPGLAVHLASGPGVPGTAAPPEPALTGTAPTRGER